MRATHSQSIKCNVQCCVKDCDRNARWLCSSVTNVTCNEGICFSHARDILRNDQVVDVATNMAGRRLCKSTTVSVTTNERISDEEVSSSSDSDGVIFAPIGQEEAYNGDDRPSLHSRKDVIPIYDLHNGIPAHFVWNKGYGVMRRKFHMHPNAEAHAMMQHIATVTDNACVSLLYPEGQLFPRTFWKSIDSSVFGAIPSFMLNCFFGDADHGIASLREHQAIRLKDGDLITSKQNSYWHYLFDLSLNQQLSNFSSKLVFQRGLEFLLESDHNERRAMQGQVIEARLPMDEAESVRRVKELASLLKKGKWTYFITLTINESETPGVRKITEAIREVADGDRGKERELTDAYLPFVLRAWEKFVRILLQELLMRNHSIIGRVHHMFYRFEFQGSGSQGNKPHVHIGVTLEPEPETVSVDRISCSSVGFSNKEDRTDFESLLKLGLIKDQRDFELWLEIVSFVNKHDCNLAGGRCMKRTNKEGEKICRYHRQPLPTWEAKARHWMETIEVPYPEDVYLLLQEMELATKVHDKLLDEDKWVLDQSLACGKWHYIAKTDEFFIASIPLLSAITRSATNVDMCDRHFQVSYLVKYVGGEEEHQLVNLSGTRNIDTARVTTEEHGHQKITSCRNIVKNNELKKQHLGREISLAEVAWFNEGFRYTYCTADFVHASTLPLAHRAAVMQYAKSPTVGSTAVEKRRAANLVPWRQFTETQEAHIEEYVQSSLSLDVTSAFNIRPPELLVFDDLQVYSECFVPIRIQGAGVSTDLAAKAWIDGAGRVVKVHSCSVQKCVSFLNRRMSSGNTICEQLLDEVFLPLSVGNAELEIIFVKHKKAREIVSVISAVKPWDRTKFLTHICLSLGHYETEMDIFCSVSIAEAMYKAGLLPSISNITRDDILCIMKKYVLADLAYHTISCRQFGWWLKSAMSTFEDVLLNGATGNFLPCLSEITLKDQAT